MNITYAVVLFQEVSRRSCRHHIFLRLRIVSQVAITVILSELDLIVSLDVISVTDQVSDTLLLLVELLTIAVVNNNRNQTEGNGLTCLVNTYQRILSDRRIQTNLRACCQTVQIVKYVSLNSWSLLINILVTLLSVFYIFYRNEFNGIIWECAITTEEVSILLTINRKQLILMIRT